LPSPLFFVLVGINKIKKFFQISVFLFISLLLSLAWIYPQLFALTWFGLAMFLYLVKDSTPRVATIVAYFTFLFALCLAFWWAPYSLNFAMGGPFWIAICVAIGMAMVEAMQIGVIFAIYQTIRKRLHLDTLFVFPFVWVAIEFFWPKICPWILGHSQIKFLPIIQIADITGGYGISFAVGCIAIFLVSLAVVMVSKFRKAELPKSALRDLAISFGIVAIVIAYGIYQLTIVKPSNVFDKKVDYRLAMIQVDPTYSDNLKLLKQMTLEFKPEQQIDLICWPESSYGNYQRDLENFKDPFEVAMKSRFPDKGFRPNADSANQLLGSGKSYEPNASKTGPYFSTAYLIDGNQEILGNYDKNYLMPTGEYVPFQDTFPVLKKWFNVTEDMQCGIDSVPIRDENGIQLGVMICYEDMYPELAQRSTRQGADILICLINGIAFEKPLALRQHLALAMLRAVECRRHLVRCGATGITCVVQPDGKIIHQQPPQSVETVVVDIPIAKNPPLTIYTRFGDWFAYLCTVFTVAAFIFAKISKRQSTDSSAESN